MRIGEICRLDATILLAVFAGLMAWAVWTGFAQQGRYIEKRGEAHGWISRRHAHPPGCLPPGDGAGVAGRQFPVLVWGAVEIAHGFGVSDLVIGLTVIALGTSLPELASSIAAIRKREHDIALGNILGSNLFNTLAVVGMQV